MGKVQFLVAAVTNGHTPEGFSDSLSPGALATQSEVGHQQATLPWKGQEEGPPPQAAGAAGPLWSHGSDLCPHPHVAIFSVCLSLCASLLVRTQGMLRKDPSSPSLTSS